MIRKIISKRTLIGLFMTCMLACKTDEVVMDTASISTLNCSSAAFSATATENNAYTGTATVPYTGGNGVAYTAGSAVSSTGVTGLTATLTSGTLASGAGNLTYTITGTPTSAGTAVFALSTAGQTCSLSLTVSTASTSSTTCTTEIGVEKIVCLANAFVNTLSTSEKASAVITLNLTNAKRWSNLPCGVTCRNGLLLGNLSATQKAAALALITAASGTAAGEGYDEFNQIRMADSYLGQSASGYSENNYIIALLGTPSTTGKWMLQFGGHHYAQNITYDAGQVTSITPLHEAVEPNGSFTYNGTTYSGPILSELNAMRTLLGSLSATELSTAKLTGSYSDCLMVPGSTTNTFPSTKQGIKVSALSATVQANVLAAIATWVNDVEPETAAKFLAIYKAELTDTYVAYASNTSATAGTATSFLTSHTDYVRIDGPTIWIEFVCQNGVVISNQIHYHTVMRDHTRDYIGL